MLLNEFALCHFLFENGYLNRNQFVHGKVRLVRQFSRNRNFKVLISEGKNLLIKQPKLSFYLRKPDLKREADLYWLTFNDKDFSRLKNHIPQFYHYDRNIQALITELIEPAISLHEYHVSLNEYPASIAVKQAEILAALHSIELNKIEHKKSASLFSMKPCWLFNIESDGWWAGVNTEANRQLMELVKSQIDFMNSIRSAKEKWKLKCLVHNDIRWSNFLIRNLTDEAKEIRLIDWELSDFGDPCWDLAGILQSYFSYWVLQHEADPFQLLKMKPAIAAFISAYTDLMKLTEEKSDNMFHLSMEFTGLRLVQSCIEHVNFHNVLDRKTIQLLQFSLNILKDPKQAFDDFILSRSKKQKV
ncbi:MAG: phosphotransferase family protein [Bacteroidia bacterium]